MIWLNPEKVTFGPFELRNVMSVAVDRVSHRTAEEWTDLGPHLGFADVPEQRVSVMIFRRILETETTGPRPGESHALAFRTSAGASAAAARLVSMSVVVTSVEHFVSSSGRATQRIRGAAVSNDGLADPMVETAVEGEV
jgi:hypothetical protein